MIERYFNQLKEGLGRAKEDFDANLESRIPHVNTLEEKKDLKDLEEFVSKEELDKLTFLENLAVGSAQKIFEKPFDSLDKKEVLRESIENYGSCTIEERYYDNTNTLWFGFAGLSDGSDPGTPFSGARPIIPKEGVVVNFAGPSGIAGLTPQQCIDSTEMAMKQVREITAKYPGYKIRVFGYSAGTHLAHYVANQLGKEEAPVDKLISVATGQSIGYGIYSTTVSKKLADSLLRAGIDKHKYTEMIAPYVQMNNIEYLPETHIFSGTNDRFIPFLKEGGTKDQIQSMKDAGHEPTVVTMENRDHVSIILALSKRIIFGEDPYGLENSDSMKLSYDQLPGHIREKLTEKFAEGADPNDPDRDVSRVLAHMRRKVLDPSKAMMIERRLGGRKILHEDGSPKNLPREDTKRDIEHILFPEGNSIVLGTKNILPSTESVNAVAEMLKKHGKG